MEPLKIEYLGVDELTPYERNARKHESKDVDSIVASIREFGFDDPIGIWGDRNVIVEGHGRLIAAKKIGMEKVPVIRLDHLTDEQRRAYALAHNRTAELSEWDFDLQSAELKDIFNINMADFGFDLPEEKEQADVVEDEVPEDVVTKCKPGDLWQLGQHRLICGDSTDDGNIERLLDGQSIDMIFTDPPYGMGLNTDYSSMVNKLEFATEKAIKNGKKYDSGNVDSFDPKMISKILGIKSKEVFIWGADYFAELIPNRNDGSWFVWDKRTSESNQDENDFAFDRMYGSCFELCWSKRKHKRDIARVTWAGVFGVEQEPEHKRFHPTQKPAKLSAWFIDRFTHQGQNILDLFGGSGSTMIACEQMKRKCFMSELDPHYCDVIIQRWENFTGEKAVLL